MIDIDNGLSLHTNMILVIPHRTYKYLVSVYIRNVHEYYNSNDFLLIKRNCILFLKHI